MDAPTPSLHSIYVSLFHLVWPWAWLWPGHFHSFLLWLRSLSPFHTGTMDVTTSAPFPLAPRERIRTKHQDRSQAVSGQHQAQV